MPSCIYTGKRLRGGVGGWFVGVTVKEIAFQKKHCTVQLKFPKDHTGVSEQSWNK